MSQPAIAATSGEEHQRSAQPGGQSGLPHERRPDIAPTISRPPYTGVRIG